MTTERTTCTGCGERYDAPIMVAAWEGDRLCPACEERGKNDRRLLALETALESAQASVDRWTKMVYAHKAAHPPLVKPSEQDRRAELMSEGGDVWL